MKIRYVPDFKLMRKKKYPPIEEFVDAYYWLQKGDEKPMAEYIAKIDKVKSSIPKLEKSTKEV